MSETTDNDLLTNISFSDGDMIFSQGGPADICYVVQSGSVELVQQDSDGFFETVEIVSPGHVFGKSALVSSAAYTVGARAVGDCKCIQISRSSMDAALEAADPFIRAMFRVLAGNLAAIMDMRGAAQEADDEEGLDDLQVEGDDDEESLS